ncbi:MAG: N-6 DNA methylase [Anaerolineaceae bacterium]|nr:N-6 DNA methylase [Anaerolineaceae bacterium]
MNKDTARQQVAQLVEKFESRKTFFRSPQYNETQVRVEFVNPLFEALGWNVADSLQVTHEAYVQVDEEGMKKPKRPDYAFRTDQTDRTRFFVETKKPAVNLKDDPLPAYQVRRYGWSAKLPVSVLTDFEEFSVYDCRIKPAPEDRAQEGRLRFYTYQEYLDKWDEIESLFSRRAVQENKLEDWIRGEKTRGAQEVDAAFLADLEIWRETLAQDIAWHNPGLSPRHLNTAVQMTLDRIIFLRICEDRGIEPYGRLEDLVKSPSIYGELTQFFRQADAKYNSGLFHFNHEQSRDEDPDEWTLNLRIDNAPLQTIFLNLYFPHSPYAFDALPSDILGQIYERFLGKVIEVSGPTVNVVEKPEVRKAGGVYYTPTYIVDYIVQNTVGKLLDGKTPEQAAALRILDPACGSGSFLIGAYQHLLDWHRDYYARHAPKTHLKAGRLRQLDGAYVLTTAEKKRILKNNLYGVDLDQQAVEVTKLSLLLKLLEGETSTTTQATLLNERVLPDLGDNIKWGNSLIGPDYYTQQNKQLSMWDMDEEDLLRVKVFDWNDPVKGFGAIMTAGGFDAVIGNPPYVRQEILGPEFKKYAKAHYFTYWGTADLYSYFIERGFSLLKQEGKFGIIVANKWMRANYGKSLRTWLKQQKIEEIVDFGDLQVFQNATTYPCILFIHRDKPQERFRVCQVSTLKFDTLSTYVVNNSFMVTKDQLSDNGWALVNEISQSLLRRIAINDTPLDKYLKGNVHYGVKTGFNEAFVIDSDTRTRLIAEHSSSSEIIKPFIIGRDIGRYVINKADRFLIFTRRGIDISKYPAIERHLTQYKERLMPRPRDWEGDWKGRKPGTYEWYEIQDTVDYYAEFEKPKIAYLVFQVKPTFALDIEGIYANNAVWIIPKADKYLLGILNSKFGWFLISNHCTQIQNGYQLIFEYLKHIPIHTINFDDPADTAQHDRMVKLVETMLDLHRQLPQAATDAARSAIQAAITSTDRAIDALVYDLYGLTAEEIRIVEGA